MPRLTKRSREGYLLIDQSAVQAPAQDAPRGYVTARPGQKLEAPTLTCHGCHRQLIVNPLRTRDRAWCPQHDAYLCDACETRRVANGFQCVSLEQVLDAVQEAEAASSPVNNPTLEFLRRSLSHG